MQVDKQSRDRIKEPDEEPPKKRARTEHCVSVVPSIIQIARIDDASRELLASTEKRDFVPHAQIEHDGFPTKKSKN